MIQTTSFTVTKGDGARPADYPRRTQLLGTFARWKQTFLRFRTFFSPVDLKGNPIEGFGTLGCAFVGHGGTAVFQRCLEQPLTFITARS